MIRIPLKYYKYIRLIINLLAWFAMGAMNEILSPTLPDLSIRVGADYEVIGRTVGFRVIGNFFTPILSGILYDRFPRTREVLFGIIFIVAGSLEIVIPHCREVWLLSLILILQGISEGALVTAAQSMIIELFGTSAASALQFMHLGWGAGSFLANVIVRPFLAPNLRLSKDKIRYACLDNVTSNATNTTTNLDNSGSQIEYAYLIIGVYAIVMGIILFIFSFFPKPRRPHDTDSNAVSKGSLKEMLGPDSISDGKPLFGLFMLICLLLIYTTDVGAYVTFSRFLVTVAIDPCKGFIMSQSEATLLQGIMAAVFSASRIITGTVMAVMLMKNIQPGFLISTCVVMQAISTILLSILGLESKLSFWILTCMYAFFHAPMFGGNTPWFNQYIRVTSTVVAVAVTGGNIGKFSFSWIGGYIFKEYNSYVFVHITNGMILVLLVVTISALVVSLMNGKRPSYIRRKSLSEMAVTQQDVNDTYIPLTQKK